ncbi:MAG: hypothetical protein KDJ34_19705, partial [Candidatus Competibacteraceae bacterium]|nr:hypothetical protein [Candidatus Competibacteraceae bacterium]
ESDSGLRVRAGQSRPRAGVRRACVRVTKSEGSESGMATVDLIFPGSLATCWVDRNYDIHDMHFSQH